MRILFSLFMLLSITTANATVVAYWNFNNLSISSADTPGSGNVPTHINADQGSGSLSLESWAGNIDDFSGSTINRLGLDTAGSSLSLLAGSSPYPGNGSSILISLNLTSLQDPTLSFATQGTATGFTSNQLSWSINGADFTDFSTPYTPPSSYQLQSYDLSTIDTLDGAENAWLRITFNGATSGTGNNRIDNLQITAIPELSTTAIGGISLLLLSLRRRRPASDRDKFKLST